uniref:Actin-related protein 4 n=1 Tax=Aplanochytrium stocchinoi TaxID=215587 RepID=A0A7S3PK16_9STRA
MAGLSAPVVIDLGSNNLRIGFAGDDKPRIRMPSYYGTIPLNTNIQKVKEAETEKSTHSPSKRSPKDEFEIRVGEDGLRNFSANMQIQSIFEETNSIKNWDALEELFRYGLGASIALKDTSGSFPTEVRLQSPVLFAENPLNPHSNRAKTAELLFEKFDAPGLFFSRAPVLSCYACGRSTGLVLDLGASQCRASVVQDGYLFQKTVRTSETAGDLLARNTLKAIESMPRENTDNNIQHGTKIQYKTVVPYYKFSKKNLVDGNVKVSYLDNLKAHQSYRRYFQHEICKDVFQSLCRVSPTAYVNVEPYSETNASASASTLSGAENKEHSKIDKNKVFQLPDGTVISDELLRYSIPEQLFAANATNPPIHELVASVSEDVNNTELRKEALNSIVLCGGVSALKGLYERLSAELMARLQKTARPRIIVAGYEERTNFAWIGGSIVASINDFKPMFVTKKEYQENGAKLLDKKCP